MYSKKKIAVTASLICCLTALCGAAVFGLSRNNKIPETGRVTEFPPTGYSRNVTETSLYTDPTEKKYDDGDISAPSESAAATEQKDEPAAAEEKLTESVSVSGNLPRPNYFELPLGRDILLDYSAAEPVFNSTMGDWRTHTGIDFKGVTGDPVKACAAGFITSVYDDPMYGVVMEIDHGGGVCIKYCGLGKGSTVPAGTEVKTNDTIAYLGTVPCESESGAHLHMEITDNGVNVDPLEVLDLQ